MLTLDQIPGDATCAHPCVGIRMCQPASMAMNGHFHENWKHKDDSAIVTGGVSCGRGFTISWHHGPLGRGNDRQEPNGAFVEDVIEAARRRIAAFQDSKFACPENAEAIMGLQHALAALDKRTRERDSKGVEGTYDIVGPEPTG